MYKADVLSCVLLAVRLLEHLVSGNQKALPQASEAFLELDECMTSCGYYFVDYDTQSIFWIEEVTTADLGLSPVMSEGHLGKVISY